jgi:hypothetical protein
MKNKRRFCWVIFIFILLAVWIAPLLEAQTQGFDREIAIKKIDKWKADIRDDLARLNRVRLYSLAAVIAVGVLGALIALLTSIKTKKNETFCKIVIAAGGFLVTILTLYSSQILKGDYRFMQKRIAQGKIVYTNFFDTACAPDILERLDTAQLEDFFNKAQDEYIKIDNVIDYDKITYEESAGTANAMSGFSGGMLFANGDMKPAWLSNPPISRDTIYFLGMADDANLTAAQNKAHSDALEKASLFYLDGMLARMSGAGGSSAVQKELFELGKITQLMAANGRVVNTYTEFDKQTRLFRGYELMGCNRNDNRDSIDVYFRSASAKYAKTIDPMYMPSGGKYDNSSTKAVVSSKLSNLLAPVYPSRELRDKIISGILAFIKSDFQQSANIFIPLAQAHPTDTFIRQYYDESIGRRQQ